MTRYHWILTLQVIGPGTTAVNTMEGLLTLAPGTTRRDAFRLALAKLVDSRSYLAGGHVLFFCLEPNDL